MIQNILASLEDFLGGRFISPFASMGIDPFKFFIQAAIFLIPAIWATLRVIRFRSGPQLAGWLFLIWFLPLIGAVLALVMVTTPKAQFR